MLEVKCERGHHWLVAIPVYWTCFRFLRCPKCDTLAVDFRLAQAGPIVNPAATSSGHKPGERLAMQRALYAEMWWCGDEECDCTQPQINERSVGYWREPGWKQMVCIIAGPYHSEPTLEETREQWEWLIEKAREMKVANLSEIEADYQKRYPEESDSHA